MGTEGSTQAYVTTITYEEAQEIVKKDCVSYAILADTPLQEVDMMNPGANTGQQDFDDRLTRDQHLRILSDPVPVPSGGGRADEWLRILQA